MTPASPHGELHVHTTGGVIVVPLLGDAKIDAALERVARLGGHLVTRVEDEARLEREAIQAEQVEGPFV